MKWTKSRKQKYGRISFLLLYVFVSCFLVFYLKPVYFYSLLIVLGPPTIINYIWLKKSGKKILIFSIITTILFAPPIELATRLADTWDVQTIFPRPFGYIPIENMIFAFINFFWVLCFYETFVDGDRSKKVSRNFKYIVFLYFLLAWVVYYIFFNDPGLIRTEYFVMSIPILILPSLIMFYFYPHIIKKTILPTVFFSIVFFVYEMVAIQIGNWWWPGEYIFTFTINGKIFPLDDVVIWYLLSTPALIAGYEIFVDDGK